VPELTQPRFDLDTLLAEIPEDEQVCRAVPRLLSQDDIRRLIQDSRRRKKQTGSKASLHED
jgi:hypothetical protein